MEELVTTVPTWNAYLGGSIVSREQFGGHFLLNFFCIFVTFDDVQLGSFGFWWALFPSAPGALWAVFRRSELVKSTC
jgi:hypothetical protein